MRSQRLFVALFALAALAVVLAEPVPGHVDEDEALPKPNYDGSVEPWRHLSASLRTKGKAAVKAMEGPNRCIFCRSLMNEMREALTAQLGELDEVPAPVLQRASTELSESVCERFGPFPFRAVCDKAVGPTMQKLNEGMKDHLAPIALCKELELCSEKEYSTFVKQHNEPEDLKGKLEEAVKDAKLLDDGVALDEFTEGVVWRLSGALFLNQQMHFTASASSVVNRMANILKRDEFAELHVRVEGHVEPSAEDKAEDRAEHEIEVSLGKAQAAANALRAGGVAEARVAATGKGSAAPLVPNNSPEHRQLNNRLDFVIETAPIVARGGEYLLPRSAADLPAAAKSVNNKLKPLEAELGKLFRPMQCAACRSVLAMVDEELDYATHLVALPSKALVWQKMADVCKAWGGVSPNDVMCSALHEDDERIATLIEQRKASTEVCIALKYCAEDGYSQGDATLHSALEAKKGEWNGVAAAQQAGVRGHDAQSS